MAAIDWEKWDALLGTKPDMELAQDIGCSLYSVLRRRKKLGIRPTHHTARGRRGIDFSQVKHLIGKKPDSEIATSVGCCKETVAAYRKTLGIKSTYHKKYQWEKFEHLMGVETDSNIARQMGCSVPSVREHRIRKGIPAPKPRGQARGFRHYDTTTISGKDSPEKISSKTGMSLSSARRYAKEATRSSKEKWTDRELDIIKSVPVVAAYMVLNGRSKDAIRRKLRELKYPAVNLNQWIKTKALEQLENG